MRGDPGRELQCRNCGRPRPAEALDRLRWCESCRRVVVRRATLVGRLAGIAAALALIAWIALVIGPSSRFLMGWLVLVAAVYFFVYKLTQRVAFELIRARGVSPEE